MEPIPTTSAPCVWYTGPEPVEGFPARMRLEHVPLLIAAPVPVDLEACATPLAKPCDVVFYSQQAIRQVAALGLLAGNGADRHRYWCVGHKSAQLLATTFGVRGTVGEREDFEGLCEAMLAAQEEGRGEAIVAFSLAGNPRDLTPVARAWGVAFHDVPVYETRAASGPHAIQALCEKLKACPPTWVALTSARGARAWLELVEAASQAARNVRLACIGPSTAEALREAGVEPALVCAAPNRTALLQAIADALSP